MQPCDMKKVLFNSLDCSLSVTTIISAKFMAHNENDNISNCVKFMAHGVVKEQRSKYKN